MISIDFVTSKDLSQFKQELLEDFRKILTEMKPNSEMEFLKSKEVKRILKCSDSTLQNYRDSGLLLYKKIGGTYYYTKDDVHRLINFKQFE